MRKVLLSFLIGSMGLNLISVSAAISLRGVTATTREGDVDKTTPIPPIPKYYVSYESELSTLYFYVRPGRDPLFAVLENYTTGEFICYPFNSSNVAIFPITEETGIWRLSVGSATPHNPRILHECLFTIENGVIMYQ